MTKETKGLRLLRTLGRSAGIAVSAVSWVLGFKRGRSYKEYPFDSVYGERWVKQATDICNSNMRVCCLCLRRRSKHAHHMMYIDLLWLAFTDRIRPLRGREKAFWHAVGVCEDCHFQLHQGNLSSSWKQVDYKRWLNHNSWGMRWRLRAGWLISWAVTLPFQLWRKWVMPTLLLWLEIGHGRRKPVRRRKTSEQLEREINAMLERRH